VIQLFILMFLALRLYLIISNGCIHTIIISIFPSRKTKLKIIHSLPTSPRISRDCFRCPGSSITHLFCPTTNIIDQNCLPRVITVLANSPSQKHPHKIRKKMNKSCLYARIFILIKETIMSRRALCKRSHKLLSSLKNSKDNCKRSKIVTNI